jgi:septum formation protein
VRAPELVLASRSPQRRAILEQVGIAFRVADPGAEELTEGDPRELVLENARRKAAAVEGDLVLGVDTEVVVDGRALGKPADRAAAELMLRGLDGRGHEVLSALALSDGRTAIEGTLVRFRALDEALLGWYLDTGEWQERAGAYAIQGRGAALVERVEGDYLNVVGLPVAALLELAPELLGRS